MVVPNKFLCLAIASATRSVLLAGLDRAGEKGRRIAVPTGHLRTSLMVTVGRFSSIAPTSFTRIAW